jgi:CheY-like chemotaxis protein
MDTATLADIFEPFSQADRTIDRSRGGLGLGLALVKGLVELHGGTVYASSPGLGHGAQFVITLPGIKTPAVNAEFPQSVTRLRNKRILVIEDNVDVAESLGILLELNGHSVQVAKSGVEGLQLARAHRPEVIICDIGLPGSLDGYGVARAIRADAELKSLYLVAMTGYGQDEDRKRAKDAGFDQHLAKPADPEELERLLQK